MEETKKEEESSEPVQETEGEVLPPKPEEAAPAQPPIEFEEDEESLAVKLEEFFKEFHISKRHVAIAAGCLVGAIVIIFGAYYGYKFLKNRGSDDAAGKTPAEAVSDESQKSKPAVPPAAISKPTRPIVIQPGDTGIGAVAIVGSRSPVRPATVSHYILTFRRLQNAYGTNIAELLNQSSNRRARFKSHVALLKSLEQEGTENLEKMKNEMTVIEEAYEPRSKTQEELDKNFFTELSALNGETAEMILNDFTAASRDVVALRARFKALQSIANLYESAMPKVTNRIKDMELNEEALVSGIKVYDVTGSDLELIVPTQGVGSGEREVRLGSPAYPFLPVHPEQITTGRDFISTPGGGFVGEKK